MTHLTTWAEIRDWLSNREPWPREILHAIARAADRNDYDQVSANDLRDDPDFHIAGNAVNTIPSIFGSCGTRGWLIKAGYVTSTSPRGHQCEVKVYEVTPEGRAAFERIVEIGAGSGTCLGVPESSSRETSPDLGDESPSGPTSPSGATGADPDGGQGKSAPSGLLPLPGFDTPDRPGYMDFDQEAA